MIVFTPLDLPKVEPDNWDLFWDIWNSHGGQLSKVRKNAESSPVRLGYNDLWYGLDVYKKTFPKFLTSWEAPYYDMSEIAPNFINSVLNTGIDVSVIRLIKSNVAVTAHTDDDADQWAIRAYLHYTSPNEQWYFTKPRDPQGDRRYIKMPKTTNWFAYNDKYVWHGTDYDADHEKILLQIYYHPTEKNMDAAKQLVERSANRYKRNRIKL
jgi:hypothetical protein